MKKPFPFRRGIAALAALVLLAAFVVTATSSKTPANAADGSRFNPGLIISDQQFYAGGAISASAAQATIATVGANCHNNGSIPCLKNLIVSSPAETANSYCAAIPATSGLNAGRVFAMVGSACNINPQVLITLVEKEQGLVSTSSPSSWMYNEAAGFACPDTAPCSEDAAGFFNQIYSAARQFQIYRQYPNSFNYQAGKTNNIQYNPNKGCGTKAVYIENQATAALYDYTPYVPNSAALGNMYGIGDSCSSYGNRNFWRIFTDWFGDPTGGSLSCPTFDGCWSGWSFDGAMDRADYTSSAAHGGSGYLAMVPHNSTAGFYQTINRSTTVGDQYQASIWLKSGSVGPVSGQFVVWGMGGSGSEAAIVPFTVTNTGWQQLTVNFEQKMLSHTALRVQIYFGTMNSQLNVDDVSLQQTVAQPLRSSVPLINPSFESGGVGWGQGNGFVNQAVYHGAAENGSSYFASNTAVAGRSVSQQIAWPVSRASSFNASVWVKSADKTPFSGILALWGLGGAATIVGTTSFTATTSWTQVSVNLPVTRTDETDLKLEVYEQTTAPATILIDNASLTANLLRNGSLEQGGSGWGPHEAGTNLQAYSSGQAGAPAVDGSKLGATNVSTSGGSIQYDVNRDLHKGQTYTASLWVRGADPSKTFTGTLALWEIGPNGYYSASVPVSAVGAWKHYTVKLTIAQEASTTLRLQLYETSPNVTVFFDAAQLN